MVSLEHVAQHGAGQHWPGTGAQRLNESPKRECGDAAGDAAANAADDIEENACGDGPTSA
jgi:hypothetical protein